MTDFSFPSQPFTVHDGLSSHSLGNLGLQPPARISSKGTGIGTEVAPSSTTAASSGSTASPRSGSRRHAHKRSGAVSMHDIKLEDYKPEVTASRPDPSSGRLQSPALTFSSSNSSSTSLPLDSPRKVSFATKPRELERSQEPSAEAESGASVTSTTPATDTVTGHKKRRSWTELIKLAKKKEAPSITVTSPPPQGQPKSPFKSPSKARPTQSPSTPEPRKPQSHYTYMEPEPIIDLDSAMDGLDDDDLESEYSSNPFFVNTDFRLHRRSESAPQLVPLDRTQLRTVKRKLLGGDNAESIIEEDEDEQPRLERPPPHRYSQQLSQLGISQAATSSTASLNSTHSGRASRYTRNYNDGLLALGLYRSQPSPIEKSATLCESPKTVADIASTVLTSSNPSFRTEGSAKSSTSSLASTKLRHHPSADLIPRPRSADPQLHQYLYVNTDRPIDSPSDDAEVDSPGDDAEVDSPGDFPGGSPEGFSANSSEYLESALPDPKRWSVAISSNGTITSFQDNRSPSPATVRDDPEITLSGLSLQDVPPSRLDASKAPDEPPSSTPNSAPSANPSTSNNTAAKLGLGSNVPRTTDTATGPQDPVVGSRPSSGARHAHRLSILSTSRLSTSSRASRNVARKVWSWVKRGF